MLSVLGEKKISFIVAFSCLQKKRFENLISFELGLNLFLQFQLEEISMDWKRRH